MAMSAVAAPVAAQEKYPERSIPVIIPFAAGSASDVVGRIVLDRMADDLGHRFVIDNQAGASGNLGTGSAARAAPDGYTILVSASGPLAVNPALFTNMGYDPLTAFEPISLLATLPNVIVVNANQPYRSVADLVAAAKKSRGSLNYGSIGNGSSQHLAAAYFQHVTGTQMTHVPYRMTGQLVTDLVGSQLQVSFQLIPNVIGQLQGGSSGRSRSPQTNVPKSCRMCRPQARPAYQDMKPMAGSPCWRARPRSSSTDCTPPTPKPWPIPRSAAASSRSAPSPRCRRRRRCATSCRPKRRSGERLW